MASVFGLASPLLLQAEAAAPAESLPEVTPVCFSSAQPPFLLGAPMPPSHTANRGPPGCAGGPCGQRLPHLQLGDSWPGAPVPLRTSVVLCFEGLREALRGQRQQNVTGVRDCFSCFNAGSVWLMRRFKAGLKQRQRCQDLWQDVWELRAGGALRQLTLVCQCAEQPPGSSGRSFLRRGSSKALQASYELVGSVVLEGNGVVRLVRGLQMTWLPARHMMFLPAELDEVMQERPGRFGNKI